MNDDHAAMEADVKEAIAKLLRDGDYGIGVGKTDILRAVIHEATEHLIELA